MWYSLPTLLPTSNIKKIQQEIVSKYCHHQNSCSSFLGRWRPQMKEQTLTCVPSLCISVCRHHWLYPGGSSPTSLGERESILHPVLPLSQLLHGVSLPRDGVSLTKGWCVLNQGMVWSSSMCILGRTVAQGKFWW